MTDDSFLVARLEEIDEIDDGRCPWRPIRHHLGITAFGVNAWTAHAAGDRLINEHDEDGEGGEEELYLVMSGRARFEVGDDAVDAPAGTLVFVEPGLRRTAFAEEPETTILAVGGVAGEAYTPAGWELWAPVNRYYESGEYERAITAIAPVIGAHPQYAGPLYNLACCESLAGRPDDALEHLGRAIAISERCRTLAQSDSDFDPIRDDLRFAALVGAS